MQRVLLATILLTFALPSATFAAAQEWPTIPDPVPVTLEPSTTALLVLDMIEFCNQTAACPEAAIPMGALLARARRAGMLVAHTGTSSPALAAVARMPGEPVVETFGADKFFRSEMDDLLISHGITTVIVEGWSGDRAVAYTAFGAAARGYTVVVPEDGAVGATQFATIATRFQLLNATGLRPNVNNAPLAPGAVTLTRTDLISFE